MVADLDCSSCIHHVVVGCYLMVADLDCSSCIRHVVVGAHQLVVT